MLTSISKTLNVKRCWRYCRLVVRPRNTGSSHAAVLFIIVVFPWECAPCACSCRRCRREMEATVIPIRHAHHTSQNTQLPQTTQQSNATSHQQVLAGSNNAFGSFKMNLNFKISISKLVSCWTRILSYPRILTLDEGQDGVWSRFQWCRAGNITIHFQARASNPERNIKTPIEGLRFPTV